jgi:hypothetical protein
MDVKEIHEKKAALERNIKSLVSEFMKETGCAPEVEIRVEEIFQFGGVSTAFVSVNAKVYF